MPARRDSNATFNLHEQESDFPPMAAEKMNSNYAQPLNDTDRETEHEANERDSHLGKDSFIHSRLSRIETLTKMSDNLQYTSDHSAHGQNMNTTSNHEENTNTP